MEDWGIELPRYTVSKYSGGVYCGNAFCRTLDECFEFANDGFCDYMRVTDATDESLVIKAHFKCDGNS